MINAILIDLDDTLLDFHRSEADSLRTALLSFGIDPRPDRLALYSRINMDQWKKLEKRETTRPKLLVDRFRLFLESLSCEVDPVALGKCYESLLAESVFLLPDSLELLDRLVKDYRLYLASNGIYPVQQGRIKKAGLEKYFSDRFVSEKIGYDKPDPRFFEEAFHRIPDFCREKTLIFGDSLSSDIQGGINAGITTVWYNPKKLPTTTVRPDFETANQLGLLDVLKQINQA